MEKNPKSVRWNDEIKATVKKKKEAAWEEMLTASDEDAKKYVWRRTEKRREKLKGVYIRAKRK